MTLALSAILIVYNQSKLLRSALDSIHNLATEIIVVDLESTEDLKSIAKTYGAKYVKLPKVEIVEQVRQLSLKYATQPYVLFLDADETVSPGLAKEITNLTKTLDYDYFEIPRQNYVFGDWVKASRWWPDYQIRLFKKGSATWPTTIHTPPITSGLGYHFAPDPALAITHHNYQNLDEWFEKNRRYSHSDALSRIESNTPFHLFDAMKLSISEFVSRYFAGRGYQDGLRGLILAILQSFYYYLVYAYYWEAKGYASLESESTLKSFPRKWFAHGLSEIMHWDKENSSVVSRIKSKLVRKMIA